MKKIFLNGVISIIFVSFFSSYALAVEIPKNPTEEIKKVEEIQKKMQQPHVPQLPQETIPTIPQVEAKPVAPVVTPKQADIARVTMENVQQINTMEQTLKQIEETKRIKQTGNFTVKLKNSKSYKKITVGLVVILEDPIAASEKLFEKYLPDMQKMVTEELGQLTDKELSWERQGRHILSAAMQVFNAKEKKPFIRAISYTHFDLT